MQYTDLSIDAETLGVGNNAVVLSLGLVLFNRKDPSVPPQTKELYLSLRETMRWVASNNMSIDASTLLFWAKQPEFASLLEKCMDYGNSVLPALVPYRIYQFIRSVAPDIPKIELADGNEVYDIDVWALGNTDFAWIRNLASHQDAQVILPWAFWRERDLRTYALTAPSVPKVYSNQPHNALADAIAQTKWLCNIEKKLHGQK